MPTYGKVRNNYYHLYCLAYIIPGTHSMKGTLSTTKCDISMKVLKLRVKTQVGTRINSLKALIGTLHEYFSWPREC